MVKKNYDDMLSRFHMIPERHGQTDRRQTDRQICCINIARQYAVGSRIWAFQRTRYWTPKIQEGGNPPSWMSTPNRKNAIFWKTKQFRAMVSKFIDDL